MSVAVAVSGIVALLASLVALATPAAAVGNNAIRTGFTSATFAGNDDGSAYLSLPFTLDYFGTNYNHVYLNNNGNLTFEHSQPTFSPFNLATNGTKIIAPFFADVDTAVSGSAAVTYGTGTVGGHTAWSATWPGVRCYVSATAGLDNFQVVLIDRTDIAPGDFDMEFNYDQIQWDTGQASGGTTACQSASSTASARVGYSDGTPANSYELTGSGVAGSFLDSHTSTNLIGHSYNSTQLGRYVFPVRSGTPVVYPAPAVTVTGVSNGATYNYSSVPAAGCNVSDATDGTSTVSPTLSAITGPRADVGLGSQTVTCSATNTHGVTGGATATYSIADQVPPVLSLPVSPDVAEATSSAGAAVNYTATATDAKDGDRPVNCTPASGSTFPLGDTTVSCSSTDTSANTATGTFTVHVSDTIAPVINATSVTADATSAAGAVVSYAASTSDAVDGPGTATCSPASGSTFPLGATTVSCTATDAAGNSSSGSLTVTVQDRSAPNVTAPDNVTAEAAGADGAAVSYDAASAIDDVDGAVPATCTPSSGSTFALGATLDTCTATDSSGNTGSATFTVTVTDTTAPVVTGPHNITAEATSPTGAAVSWAAPTASDAVDGAPAVTCDHTSGSAFPLGTTTVNCSSTDAAGNTGTAPFTVTVGDTTAPTLTVSGDQVAEATSPEGAPANYDAPTATDIVDGSDTASCSPSSGSTFGFGDTTVACTATDAAGNTGTKTFTVTVHDTTAPSITVPANQAVSETGPSGAAVTFTAPSVTDNGDASPTIGCDHASGATYPLGTTTITCTATDHSGNSSSGSFTIKVQDVTKPVVQVPADSTAEATGPTGTTVYYSGVSATDDVDGTLPTTCDHATGSTMALGTTTVTCSATDSSGNVGVNHFTVTVVDATAPALTTSGDINTSATSTAGATVNYSAAHATDIVDGTVAAACDKASGSVFSLGLTTVTCSATDAHGNTATKRFTVTVTYAFGGFAQPVVAGGSYKLGSTIPVKFTLTGASAAVSGATAKLYVAQVGTTSTGTDILPVASGAANTGNLFRWDGSGYIFNWSTKGLAAGTWRIRADLGDGADHEVVVTLRS
jgi:hypothetical protein